jgi:hypothetical protein
MKAFNEAGVCRWCAVSEPVDLDAWRATLAREDEHLYAHAEALKRVREERDAARAGLSTHAMRFPTHRSDRPRAKILPALGRWLRSHVTFEE